MLAAGHRVTALLFIALTELLVVLLEEFAERKPLIPGVVDAVEAALRRVELDEPGSFSFILNIRHY